MCVVGVCVGIRVGYKEKESERLPEIGDTHVHAYWVVDLAEYKVLVFQFAFGLTLEVEMAKDRQVGVGIKGELKWLPKGDPECHCGQSACGHKSNYLVC